ncbi:LLM class flavin-dependent oxidoreductase [Oerskovia sp. KBS0722]|nr:LLM class flavin-dependent oxidoreductase [Oerskovia sp. KBS0722]
MRISVVFPQQPHDMADLKVFARWVAERPGTRLWSAQSTLVDSLQAGAYLAGAGIRVPIGLGVALTPMVHPVHAAVQARSLAILTGHDVWAGFGTGGKDLESGFLGQPYRKPASAVGEYLTIARHAMDGGEFVHDGEQFTVRGGLVSVDSPRVALGAGVLREGMARVAGRTADFVVTWLAPLPHLTDRLIPELARSATAHGRTMPQIVSMVHLGPLGVAPGSPELASYALTPHLWAGHYRSMLRHAGLNSGDSKSPADLAQALVDERVVLGGDLDAIVDQLVEYRAAGVAEVALNPLGTHLRHGAGRALADVAAVYDAYARHTTETGRRSPE